MKTAVLRAVLFGTLFAVALWWPVAWAAQSQNPLTNQDIVHMVKNALPESVILAAIQNDPTNFDTSVNALIALHKAGVNKKVMDAMMASAANRQSQSAPSPPSAPLPSSPPLASPVAPTAYPISSPPAQGPTILGADAGNAASGASPIATAPVSTASMTGGADGYGPPTVELMPANPAPGTYAPQVAMHLPIEKTQLAQTATKPTSMTSLASDSVLTQALQGGVTTVTTQVMMHTGSSAAGSAFGQAGSIFSSVLAHRRPPVTYVWALPGPNSSNLASSTPTFYVVLSGTPGVNADEYAPAIVKLTPSQNAFRLVGATQGKEDATSNSVPDWQIYSKFLEDRVAVTVQKLGPGQYDISPASPLLPGEYGVVFRPVSKTKKFSGGDVARDQGDGMLFDSVWSFEVK